MVINNNGTIKTPSVLLREEGCCWHRRCRLQLSAEDGTNVSFPLNYKYEAAFLNVWCLLPSPTLFPELVPSPDWFIVLIMSARVNSCSTHNIAESLRTQLLKEWKVSDAYKSWRHTYYLINEIRSWRVTRQICGLLLWEKKKKKDNKGSGTEKNLKMNLSLMSTFLYFYQRKQRNPSLTPVMVAADKDVKEGINNISANFPFRERRQWPQWQRSAKLFRETRVGNIRHQWAEEHRQLSWKQHNSDWMKHPDDMRT